MFPLFFYDDLQAALAPPNGDLFFPPSGLLLISLSFRSLFFFVDLSSNFFLVGELGVAFSPFLIKLSHRQSLDDTAENIMVLSFSS